MKKVYDIVVNFKRYPYEFYEWDKTDKILLITETQTFKVNNKTLFDIINNEVILEKKFLSIIEKCTKYYSKNQIKTIKYACILRNEDLAISILLNENGLIIGKSKLLFDEESEIINNNDTNININYEIVKKNNINKKLTRRENKELKIILNYLNNIYTNKKIDEINYMYYECFNKKQRNYVKSYNLIKQELTLGNFEIINKIKSIIKV